MNRNLADLIEHSLQQYHDKPAFHCLRHTLTFAEVDKKSQALACYLQQCCDLQPGDRIAIQLPNIMQFPIAAYAAIRAGLVLVNTNPQYTAREMLHQFVDSGAKAIIILQDLLPKLDEIKATTAIDTVISTTATDLFDNIKPNIAGVTGFNQAMEVGATKQLAKRPESKQHQLAVLQYTGGTTGPSKGACLTHENLLTNATQINERLAERCQEANEIFVCPLPLYHIYAFTVNMLAFFNRGNLNVLIPNPRDMDAFVGAIKLFKFTGFSGINTLFVALCQHPEFSQLDFSNFKFTISGGSALSGAAVDAWHRVTGCTISEGYGLSETSPVLCLNHPGKEHIGTVGLPLRDTEIELWDENDRVVAPGQEGQIVARGGQVMTGYWQQPEETRKVLSRDGWFKTGDVGIRMDDGCIKIVDRLKDLIIVSGFNVYPNEVEEVITQHPDVLEAAVVGKHDDKTGESVVAYITTDKEITEQQILTHCKEQLTGYKTPKTVVFLEQLPKSTVGKILRRELR